MRVSARHILSQKNAIASMGKIALAALVQQVSKPEKSSLDLPQPQLQQTVRPPSRKLVRDYLLNIGGHPKNHPGVLPPHLFPQWGLSLSAQTLLNIPYPLFKVINGGCRLEINAPLPDNEPLQISAQLMSINDNGRRAVLNQKVTTGTADIPDALVAHLYPIIPLIKKEDKEQKSKGPTVPKEVHEIDRWKLNSRAGLSYAKLTGDFNPIHWIPVYAKASGFKNAILHGFASMAMSMERLEQKLSEEGKKLTVFDVRFTRPLVLPAEIGLYIDDQQNIYLGDAPGGPTYLTGHFKTN